MQNNLPLTQLTVLNRLFPLTHDVLEHNILRLGEILIYFEKTTAVNTAFFLVTLVLNNSVQPLTDPQAVQLLLDCFNHEFLLSHPAFTQTQSLPYMQPARCLGWKFSTEEASVVCMLVIYLNCIFLFNIST